MLGWDEACGQAARRTPSGELSGSHGSWEERKPRVVAVRAIARDEPWAAAQWCVSALPRAGTIRALDACARRRRGAFVAANGVERFDREMSARPHAECQPWKKPDHQRQRDEWKRHTLNNTTAHSRGYICSWDCERDPSGRGK